MTSSPALQLLLQAYLGLDWPEDYGDPWEALADFLASEPESARTLKSEIEVMLASADSDAELRRVVVEEIGSGYLPEADGLTYRGWLLEVCRRVDLHHAG